MVKHTNTGNRFTRHFIYQHRFTLLSILIICAMITFFSVYHDKEGVFQKFVAPGAPSQLPIGGAFDLVDDEGRMVNESLLNGKFSLVFFGFTYCPDICPTGLAKLSEVYASLPPDQQEQLQILFVSVDPERDTPAVLHDYVQAFSPAIIGLTGTPSQTADMAKKYFVYHAKVPGENGAPYMVNHSAHVYFMGPDGQYIRHFSHHDDASEIVQHLNTYLAR